MPRRSIVESTHDYEGWLEKQITLLEEDIAVKHAKMAVDPFQFMRATFYRWCELWTEQNPELAKATRVLGVGDLHIQNFGTWRDSEGRLVWGVNDFDEAGTCSFANDLVRIAVSARFAADQDTLMLLSQREVARSLLEGYQSCLAVGGRPLVLDRRHPWLLRLARIALKEPREFWTRWLTEKTESLPKAEVIPRACRQLVIDDLPGKVKIDFRWKKRGTDPKGLGGLGHPRFFGLIDWEGGPVAREIKATSLSAFVWAAGRRTAKNQMIELINKAVRSRDPFVKMRQGWFIRPIAADCGRIDLDDLDAMSPEGDRHEDQLRLVRAMGFEAANIHLGSVSAANLTTALQLLTVSKLREAASKMFEAVRKDFLAWKKSYQERMVRGSNFAAARKATIKSSGAKRPKSRKGGLS